MPDSNLLYSWIYTLSLSADACFRFKLKNRGFEDLPLVGDWAYFVNQKEYEDYVKLHKGEEYVREGWHRTNVP